MSSFELSVLFFLQLTIILLVCRIVGWAARWIGQPQVVGEMIAGVLLGPSLAGWLFPDLQAWLFPADSKSLLYAVSQVGLVLYMFLVGLEFDTELIRSRLRSAVGVSVSGILTPFVLGCGLGFFLIQGGGIFYAFSLLTVGKKWLRWLGTVAEREQGVRPALLTTVLALVMLGAWFTDRIGIYAVFGAFIMGAAMPRGRFAHEVQRQIEPLTTSFLLPLFFVYSGLHTRITLLDTPWLWLVALVVLLLACLGKGIACWAAARLSGEDNRSAMAIGALMNARGLMELIILNIGLERGIITPLLFAVMVVMAIATTLMATPIFEWIYGSVRDARPASRTAAPS